MGTRARSWRGRLETLAGQGTSPCLESECVGRVVGCPADDLLLRAPDYSPDIQHHHPTHAAAEADGEQAIAFQP